MVMGWLRLMLLIIRVASHGYAYLDVAILQLK